MDRYRSQSQSMHRDQIWNLISDYRYLAPVKMALDENRDRLLADAALSRILPVTDRAIAPRPVLNDVRYRLGQRFIRLGALLCGTPQPIPSA